MATKLSETLTKEIYALGTEGRNAWKRGEIDEAETQFLKAWDVLPEPKEQYDLAPSLCRGFVIFYRDTKQFDKARHWLAEMRKAYGSGVGPDLTVGFLSGTVYFEAGDLDKAAEFFRPLFEQYGNRPFSGEDKKYLDFVKRVAKDKKS
jgi:tetratricopeptide (TPR) repeat protein